MSQLNALIPSSLPVGVGPRNVPLELENKPHSGRGVGDSLGADLFYNFSVSLAHTLGFSPSFGTLRAHAYGQVGNLSLWQPGMLMNGVQEAHFKIKRLAKIGPS